MSFLNFFTVFMVAASIFILVRVQTVWSIMISVSLFIIAFVVQKAVQQNNRKMTVNVSAIGIVWFHPVKGGGTMRWGNVGALSVREKPCRGELALMVTPRDMEAGAAMVVEASDLASSQGEGRVLLVELAGGVIAKMPPDAVMDRSTRAWAERMGWSRGKG